MWLDELPGDRMTDTIVDVIECLLDNPGRDIGTNPVLVEVLEHCCEDASAKCADVPVGKLFVLFVDAAWGSVSFEKSGQRAQSPLLSFPPDKLRPFFFNYLKRIKVNYILN